jgi:hypothetical protein
MFPKADMIIGELVGTLHMLKKTSAEEYHRKKTRVMGILAHDVPWSKIQASVAKKCTFINEELAEQIMKKDQEDYMHQWNCGKEECRAHGFIVKDADGETMQTMVNTLNQFKPAKIGEITDSCPPEIFAD